MQIKHLDHLNMTVADLDASVDWYGRVFGFESEESGLYRGQRWAILRSGEGLLCLYEYPENESLTPPQLRERRIHHIAHFGFRITDAEEWERTIEREGVQVEYDGVVTWPKSRSWYVFDPTGYEIEVALWEDDEIRFPTEADDYSAEEATKSAFKRS